jgi:hypothetical protein
MVIERESGLKTGRKTERKTDINTDKHKDRERDTYIQMIKLFERQTHRIRDTDIVAGLKEQLDESSSIV